MIGVAFPQEPAFQICRHVRDPPAAEGSEDDRRGRPQVNDPAKSGKRAPCRFSLNADAQPSAWTATTDEILAKVRIVQANIKKLVDNNSR